MPSCGGGIIVVLVLIILMCESVSVAVCGGGTGATVTQQTHEEAKTNTGNTATDRTLLELELSCPAGTSGIALTPPPPRGHRMEPDISVGGESRGSIYSREGWGARTLMFSSPLQPISGPFVYLRWRTGTWRWGGGGVGGVVKQSWLDWTRSAALQTQIHMDSSSKNACKI